MKLGAPSLVRARHIALYIFAYFFLLLGLAWTPVAVTSEVITFKATTFKECPECPLMRVIPAGEFVMGSADGEPGRDEGPLRTVRFTRPFALGVYEVSVAEFRRFVMATGYEVAQGCRTQQPVAPAGQRTGWQDSPANSWLNPGFVAPLREDMPVVCVGRIDALAFVEWLARQTGQPYRLPSEAEWEYSARAGSSGIFHWGNNEDLGCAYANQYDRRGRDLQDFGWSYANCDDGFAELAPVGQLQPNAFGLHDMLGNVWEWTADCYRPTYEGAPTDGSAVAPSPGAASVAAASGECALWSVRGGSWMTRPSRQRLTFRGRDPNDARYSYFGFRVARDLRP